MSKLRSLRLMAWISPGLLAGVALAQMPAESAPESTATAATGTSSIPTENAMPSTDDHSIARFASALDGTGLISLGDGAPNHLLLGTTLSGGWDSNPASLSNGASTGFYTVSPYVAFKADTPTSQYLLQYQLTASGYDSRYDANRLHTGSVRVVRNPSARLSLDFEAMGSYGQNAVRFLAPQQSVPVGEVPGTGPASGSYISNTGNVTYVSSSLTSSYGLSARNSMGLQLSNSYSDYSNYQGSNSVATANLAFARELSPILGLSTYAQTSHYYGALSCESYGGGLGLHWKPNERTSLALSGGPQISTAACGRQQSFAYNVSIGTRFGRSQVYLLSARQPATSFLGPGLWQQSVSAGYQRQVNNVGAVRLDVGYLRNDSRALLNSYKATYFDAIYTYALGHGLVASYTYRGYLGGEGGSETARHLAMFSLDWTPGRGLSFIR